MGICGVEPGLCGEGTRWAGAATLTVNSLVDDTPPGDGLVTLREAVFTANTDTLTDLDEQGSGADGISFDPSLVGGTVQLQTAMSMDLGSSALHITSWITILGDLDGGAAGLGGAILNFGMMSVKRCTFRDNAAIGGDGSPNTGPNDGSGGGGGGMLEDGDDITGCNGADGFGGGGGGGSFGIEAAWQLEAVTEFTLPNGDRPVDFWIRTLPHQPLQQDVLDIASPVDDGDDVHRLFLDPVEQSPGRDHDLPVACDPVPRQLGHDSTPPGSSVQLGCGGLDLLQDIQGDEGIVLGDVLGDPEQIHLGGSRPEYFERPLHSWSIRSLIRANTSSWVRTFPCRMSSSPRAASFSSPRAFRVLS